MSLETQIRKNSPVQTESVSFLDRTRFDGSPEVRFVVRDEDDRATLDEYLETLPGVSVTKETETRVQIVVG